MAVARRASQGMGFQGFVVSDYYAIWELHYRPDTHGHFVAKDKKEACELAVRAGVNIEFPEPDCYLHLVELVRKGALKESQLDDLVAPMLFWKFKMGLFEEPYVDVDEAERIVGCDNNRKLALQAARETITLLKNSNNLVPLNPSKINPLRSLDQTLIANCLAVIAANQNFPRRCWKAFVPKLATACRCHTAKVVKSPWAVRGIRIWSRPVIRKMTAS